ncbi:hypothetical protein FQZ97_1041750 [compost metagenome]
MTFHPNLKEGLRSNPEPERQTCFSCCVPAMWRRASMGMTRRALGDHCISTRPVPRKMGQRPEHSFGSLILNEYTDYIWYCVQCADGQIKSGWETGVGIYERPILTPVLFLRAGNAGGSVRL